MDTVSAAVSVLRWAARRANLSDDGLSQRFRKWQLWLNGEASPTLRQLEDFARLTHTPIGYFFLSDPLILTLPVPDFRTLRDKTPAEPSLELLDTLYLCQQRQDWYREYARINGLQPLSFVGNANIRKSPETVAQNMREAMGVSDSDRKNLPSWTDALRRMIARAEDAGVLIMGSSVVGGNSHRKLDVVEFRGFIDNNSLWRHYRKEQERLEKLKRREKGGDFYLSLWARTGKRFARALLSNTLEGHTLFRDAFRMLGVRKTSTFYAAARELEIMA